MPEKDDVDLKKIIGRLGERAKLIALERRELENYLLVPRAVLRVISEKTLVKGVTEKDIATEIATAAQRLRPRVEELLLVRTLCGPEYIDRMEGTPKERIEKAIAAMNERLKRVDQAQEENKRALDKVWNIQMNFLAPGSEILAAVFSKYGLRYRKESDGPRIAEALAAAEISDEIKGILRSITARL